ncbi:MAG: beta-galactosidase [Clostridia bacterium]|nr:beta-galactosidase [Clostridia bacterium]
MRILKIILIFALVLSSVTPRLYAENIGEGINVPAVFRDDAAMIPVSCLSRAGIDVTMIGASRVMLSRQDVMIIAEDGCNTVFVNGVEETCDPAPYSEASELYVPAEKILHYFGYGVEADGDSIKIKAVSELEKMMAEAETVDGMYLGGELLGNASFEDDFMLCGGWANRVNCRVSQTSEQVVDGEFAGLVTERTMGWSSITQDVCAALQDNGKGKYRISGYLRTKDEPCEMRLDLVTTNSASQKTSFYDVKTVDNTDWTYFEFVSDIQWELDLVEAIFYAEATSHTGKACEVQDYYIDNCSLRKLMTAEEYAENLKKLLAADEIEEKRTANAEKYRQLSEKHSKDKMVSVYPEENREVLINPYKGLMMYPYYTALFSGDMSKGAGKIAGLMYMRHAWSLIEPEEGKYRWDIIDANLEFCRKNGIQYGIGLGSTINFNSNTNFNQDTPEWVFEAGAEYTVEDMGNGCVLKIPVYEDPVFREKMQNMIDAFAERYNDNETFAYVDMRNYGNWGEWHFYQLPVNRELASKRSQKELFELIDMWKNVRLPLLSFVARRDVSQYALDTLGAGVRADGVMNPELLDNHKNFEIVKNKAIAVAEWFANSAAVYLPGGKYEKYYGYMPIFYERVVTEGAVSMMAFANWAPEEAYENWPDLYKRMANLIGYWYKPVKIEHSEDITHGLIKMRIKNDGVAPLFAGRDKNACVKLALADSDNNILDTVVLDGVDPIDWLVGEYTECAAEYKFENTEGGMKLLLGVFTRESNEKPNVKLGIKAEITDGWYDISSMSTSDLSDLSHNKLYKATQLYADDEYGFRRPEHAFDRDEETFWANKCRSGEYLEIDFGEQKSVSSVNIKSVDTAKIKHSVWYLAGNNKWVKAADGASLAARGATLKFKAVNTRKLRIMIDETKDAVFRLKEITVK